MKKRSKSSTSRPPNDFHSVDEFALASHFTLTPKDREVILGNRGAHNRLGFALQICWLRYLGWQPADVRSGAREATQYVGRQLSIGPSDLKRYGSDRRTHQIHAAAVRDHLGWIRCGPEQRDALEAYLFEPALQHGNIRTLVDAARMWLRKSHICRPRIDELERMVKRVRKRANDEVWKRAAAKLPPQHLGAIEALVAQPPAGTASELTKLVTPVGQASGPNLVETCKQIERLRALGVEDMVWEDVRPSRRETLALEIARLDPRDLRGGRTSHDRRHAILASVLFSALLQHNDDAIEMHDQLMLAQRAKAKHAQNEALLANRGAIIWLIGILYKIVMLALRPWKLIRTVGIAIRRVYKEKTLRKIAAACRAILDPATDDGLSFLRARYPTLRRFGPHFLSALNFTCEASNAAASRVMAAVEHLRNANAGLSEFAPAPMDWLSLRMRATMSKGSQPMDRALWEIYLHERLAHELRAGDIWVEHSREHLPLDRDIAISDTDLQRFLKEFPHLRNAKEFLRLKRSAYEKIISQAERTLPVDEDPQNGLPVLDINKDDTEQPSTRALRDTLFGFIPMRQLSQVMRQVANWIDFLAPFKDQVADRLRMTDFVERLLFVIVGEGCNIGLDNMAAATNRYSYHQLAYVSSLCMRPDVIKRAINILIKAYIKLPIAKLWGEGVWSSADGQLFPIGVKTLRARFHPKAPRGRRVVNVITHVLDSLIPYFSVLAQTTSHENVYHLDGLLNHEGIVRPKRHTSDTAGYTDLLFGYTSCLAIFFAPRVRDPKSTKLYAWLKEDGAKFPITSRYLTGQINTRVIERNWQALLNIVAAAWLGITPPSRSMRKLEALGNRNRAFQALEAVGHIEKTIIFLSYAVSPELRQEVIRQNTKTEHFNQLQDRVFFGNKGVIKQSHHTDIQTRMLCLRLITAVVIVYNAAWIQAVVRALRGVGQVIPNTTLAHVWPTMTRNVNMLGFFIADDTPELQIGIDELHATVRTDSDLESPISDF